MKSRPTLSISLAGSPVLQAYEARTFYTRLQGLHAVWPLATDEALIISPCNAIHTLTMREAIDVAFICEDDVVLEVQTVPRFRFSRCARARRVIEMPEGTLQRLGVQVGDVLSTEQLET